MIVHDLGLAAYLLAIKQYKLKTDPYMDKRGRFNIEIDIDEDKFKKIEWEYVTTEFKKFDGTLKFLKRFFVHPKRHRNG